MPPGVVLQRPIHVVYLSSQGERGGPTRVSSPRLLVVVGEEGEADIVEEFQGGGGGGWVNAVVEMSVGRRGRVGHVTVQQMSRDAFFVKRSMICQVGGARMCGHHMGLWEESSRMTHIS